MFVLPYHTWINHEIDDYEHEREQNKCSPQHIGQFRMPRQETLNKSDDNKHQHKPYDDLQSPFNTMFDKCDRLEYVKTPIGLKTRASGVNRNFKVVKLKSGSEATVEHESVNLNSSFSLDRKSVV